MPASMATKLGIHLARFAQYGAATAASNNAGTHGLRNAFANASNGSGSAWAPGLSSGGSASANSTGIGGAKFQAGRGAHSSFQNSGRALANANGSSANDGTASVSDEDDDASLHSTHGAAQIHRPFFQERRASIFQRGLRSRLMETSSTLHLILPSSSSPNHEIGTRGISTSPTQSSTSHSTSEKDESSVRQRSLSTSASQGQEAVPREDISSEGIIIGQQSSPFSKARLEGEAEKIYLGLVEAIRSGKNDLMRLRVDVFRELPKEQLSTAAFHVAMQIVLHLKQQDATNIVLELYKQMVDSDCAPNNRTYAHLIRALCLRDVENNVERRGSDTDATWRETGKEIQDADFNQAVSLLELVHSSSTGFLEPETYNFLLRSCMIRGDAKTACLVVDKLSANKKASPNSTTFLHLLGAFKNDVGRTDSETVEAYQYRKLQACEQVFEEFELSRSAEEWPVNNSQDVRVWNTMISAYILHGNAAKAMELVQKMLGVEPMIEGRRSAPSPSEATSRNIIRNLLQLGDVSGAASWFEQVLSLNNKVQEGQRQVMPLPNAITMATLFKNILQSLPSDAEGVSKLVDSNFLSLLPTIETANRVLDLTYKKASSVQEDSTAVGTASWRQILFLNATAARELIKAERLTEASTFSDACLSHIEQFFTIYPSRVSWISIKDMNLHMNSTHVSDIRSNAHAILQVIEVLLTQDRYYDAAACFTYAVAATPPEHWYRQANGLAYEDLEQSAFPIMGFCRDNIGVETGEESKQWKLKEGVTLVQHLQITLEYILPAMQHLQSIPNKYKARTSELYLKAREQVEATELKIDVRGWGYLINALTSYTRAQEELGTPWLEMLIGDLAALSEEDRDKLSLQPLIKQLPDRVGRERALELLQMIRPTTTLQLLTDEVAEKDVESSSSTIEGQANTSVTESTSPITSETSLDSGETAASDYSASLSFSLSPVETIDADFGQDLLNRFRLNRSYRTVRNQANQANQANQGEKLQRAFADLSTSIQSKGVYPTLDGICELINQFGRSGDVEKVKELYLIGSHVITALDNDPNYQMHSWYDLEDTTTAALAHGGDPKLANEHRVKLLQAGRVPKADTYAAMITVIRDTTDEALVAEELFDESQRLGVAPTVYLYNTVLSKLSRARKAERALQLFDEMRNRGLQPTSITYGAVLNSCTRTGDEVNAERFFHMMESDVQFRPKAPPYNTMIQFYTQTKPNRQKALEYYGKFCKMNVEHTTHTYKLLLDVYGTIAPVDLEAVKNVFGRLIADPTVEVQGNHWASLISAYGIHNSDLQKAIDVYYSIPTHVATVKARKRGQEPDALAFEALLTVCAEHKRVDLMEQYIEQRKRTGCMLTAYVANVLIKAYSTLVPEDGLQRARSIFEEMQDPPMGMAAEGNHPLQRHHISGPHHDGVTLLGEATKLGFNAVKREPSTFEAMIRAEMGHGNVEEATTLISRMQSRGYPPVVVARAQDILSQPPAQ